MKSLFVFAFTLCMVSMCKKEKVSTDSSIPACVQSKIDEIKKQPKWNPAGEINEYLYNGKKVYLLNANCCDQFYTLMDDQCNVLCAPSGGFGGKGDGKCPDFEKNAKLLRLVWRDNR